MLVKNKELADKIGDPYKSEKVCERIAHIIYQEMVNKIYKGIGVDIDEELKRRKMQEEMERSRPKRKQFSPRMTQEEVFYHNTKWSSQSTFNNIMQWAKKKAHEKQYGVPPPKQEQQKPLSPPPPPKIDWKKILQLPEDKPVTEKLIKVYFRKLSRKYHPDLGGDEEKMKELIEARNEAFKEIGKF